MKKFLALMMVVSMGVAACGDGNGGGGGGGGGGGSTIDDTVAEEQASSLASQASNSFANLVETPNDDKAIADLFTVYANALGVASAGNQTVAIGGEQGTQEAAPVDSNVVNCVSTSGGTTTWDNCNFSGYTLDGTITVSGDQLDIDLSIVFSAVTITFQGSLTVTPTLIDGTFSVNSTVQSVGFAIDVTFDVVELSAGCPVGGSIIVDPSLSTGQIRSVQADFGPACGDVTLTER